MLLWKNTNTDWGHYNTTLPLIAKSSIDQVSVECAASQIQLDVLDCLSNKEVMVGVIDVGTEEIESPVLVAERIRNVLNHVGPEKLIACTDCGMVPRSRFAAEGKIKSLAAGTAIVNREIGI